MIGTAMVLLAVAAFWWKAQPVDDELLDKRTLEALDLLLAKTRFTLFPFLPSYWLSSSVLQWAEGILRGAAFFVLVLLSHTLFFGGIAFTRFGHLFYDTASAVQSRAGSPTEMVSRRPESAGLPPACSKKSRRNCSGSPATYARWRSKTCGCSGATPRNGASR